MVKNEFNPNIFHPYYFIRKNLYQSIKNNSPWLKGRLLDFGCGAKPYKSLFVVDEYIGVDFVNDGHPHENEEVDVYYDGKSIPFNENSFDSILCSEVFEHLFNLQELLPQLRNVLKPEGCILITCPFVWPLHEKPYDYARYTPFALKSILEQHGFKVLTSSKSGNFLTACFQLQIAYINDILLVKLTIPFLIRLARKIAIPLMNITGILLNKIFPANSDLYLNNIVVAQKQL